MIAISLAEDAGNQSAMRGRKDGSYKNSQYYRFATYYVDNKDNLKDIME